jgi:tetratricopeptide (TPR) repeat protein
LEEAPLSYLLAHDARFFGLSCRPPHRSISGTLAYIDESKGRTPDGPGSSAQTHGGARALRLGTSLLPEGPQYADQAAANLEAALAAKIDAPDIHEYLGLAYAALHDYKKSVIAFSQALGSNPSDLLLLAIAKSYIELGERDSARAYLIRCAGIPRIPMSKTGRLLLENPFLRAAKPPARKKNTNDYSEIDARTPRLISVGELLLVLGVR